MHSTVSYIKNQLQLSELLFSLLSYIFLLQQNIFSPKSKPKEADRWRSVAKISVLSFPCFWFTFSLFPLHSLSAAAMKWEVLPLIQRRRKTIILYLFPGSCCCLIPWRQFLQVSESLWTEDPRKLWSKAWGRHRQAWQILFRMKSKLSRKIFEDPSQRTRLKNYYYYYSFVSFFSSIFFYFDFWI